jgi:hypothetical protein
MTDELVTISSKRLQQLLNLEASLPDMIQNAVTTYKKDNLRKLHQRDKENPGAINARVKRYMDKHRDEINRKRREKRQQLKESATIHTEVTNTEFVPIEEITIETIAEKAVCAIKPKVRTKIIKINNIQRIMSVSDDVMVEF